MSVAFRKCCLGEAAPYFPLHNVNISSYWRLPPLKLYEVVGVTPGKCMSLKDMLLPEQEQVLVMEKAGSERLVEFDLIGARILRGRSEHRWPYHCYRLFSRDCVVKSAETSLQRNKSQRNP